MATWGSWRNALGQETALGSNNTVKTYSAIHNQGLCPVIWDTYDLTHPDQTTSLIVACDKFITKNKPCLFIYDPKTPLLKKGFLFGITNMQEVHQWLQENEKNLIKYNYLVTTQVENHGRGYVGSVFSDGKGNMLCETMHKPGVSNQRELSQPKEDISRFLDGFTLNDYDLKTWRGKMLTKADINEISKEFSGLEGYFEFVYGKQAGKVGIVTTGFESYAWPLIFPQNVIDALNMDPIQRLQAATIKHNG